MIDVVFVWESNNGVLTIEIPFGWDTPRKRGGTGDSPLTKWKKLHREKLDELRNLSRT